MRSCNICSTEMREAFTATVLGKYSVRYYSCPSCEYLTTEEPHWLNEAYQRTINVVDTGIMSRNLYYSKLVSVFLYRHFRTEGKFLDYAGGYGIFTRLMRDIGFDYFWHDPYCENLLVPGFEHLEGMSYEAVTAFEVFEHLTDPSADIKKMLSLSGTVLFSTELLTVPVPSPKDWWYYLFESGQHVSFYSKKTLQRLAYGMGLRYFSAAGLHIITDKNLSGPMIKVELAGARFGAAEVVRRLLKSRVWSDHLALSEKKR